MINHCDRNTILSGSRYTKYKAFDKCWSCFYPCRKDNSENKNKPIYRHFRQFFNFFFRKNWSIVIKKQFFLKKYWKFRKTFRINNNQLKIPHFLRYDMKMSEHYYYSKKLFSKNRKENTINLLHYIQNLKQFYYYNHKYYRTTCHISLYVIGRYRNRFECTYTCRNVDHPRTDSV